MDSKTGYCQGRPPVPRTNGAQPTGQKRHRMAILAWHNAAAFFLSCGVAYWLCRRPSTRYDEEPTRQSWTILWYTNVAQISRPMGLDNAAAMEMFDGGTLMACEKI